jgi:hypothetical protein
MLKLIAEEAHMQILRDAEARQLVRKVYPDATTRFDGSRSVVRCGNEKIAWASTTEEAWRIAARKALGLMRPKGKKRN